MSLQSDITYSVKQIIEEVKAQIERNLHTAVNNDMLTLDRDKIPGICKLASDSVDQAFVEKSDLLVNAISRHSK
tara:strand:- start:1101 stop:1322 length:222 start_codon:yes stop_codon:yes gene_type:complete